jgi:hypothetical protein
MEAFEQRLKNPTCYWVFYDYFLRAAVGDEDWKANTGLHKPGWTKKKTIQDPPRPSTITSDNTKKRMSTCLDEAFALLILKNNYFAWLMDRKDFYKDKLMTDYDTSNHLEDAVTLPEHIMNREMFIDLRDVAEMEDEVVEESHGERRKEEYTYTVRKINEEEGDDLLQMKQYEEALSIYRLNVEQVRLKVKDSAEYKSLTEAIVRLNDEKDEGTTAQRDKKKRKVLKEMKTFTGGKKGQERAFRGWSDRAFVQLLELKKQINAEKVMYERFERAYKALHKVIKRRDGEQDVVVDENAPVFNEDHFAELWEEDD